MFQNWQLREGGLEKKMGWWGGEKMSFYFLCIGHVSSTIWGMVCPEEMLDIYALKEATLNQVVETGLHTWNN